MPPENQTNHLQSDRLVHLRAGGVSVLLDLRGGLLPAIVHWGRDAGELSADEALALAIANVPPQASNTVDEPVRVAILPEQHTGWLGRPGLSGSRDGRAWSPSFRATELNVEGTTGTDARLTTIGAGGSIRVHATDPVAALDLAVRIELSAAGVLRASAELTNRGEVYRLDELSLAFPVPARGARDPRLRRPLGQRAHAAAPRAHGRHPRARGPHGSHRRRRRHPPQRRRARLRLRDRRGLGRSRRLQRQPPPLRRAPVQRLAGGGRRRAAAARRDRPRHGRDATGRRGSTASTATGSTTRRTGSTGTCGPGRSIRARPRPVTLNVWEAVYFDHDLDRAARPRRPRGRRRSRALRARRRLVPAPARRQRGPRRLVRRRGRLAERADPADRPRARPWAWSSGSGSNPRWSTSTRTSPARIPSGSCRRAAGCPLPSRHQQVLNLGHPGRVRVRSRADDRRSSPSTTSPTSSGITTATWSTPARRPGGAPGVHAADPRGLPADGRAQGSGSPDSRSSRARRAARASTSE